jgi:hypothetical protein
LTAGVRTVDSDGGGGGGGSAGCGRGDIDSAFDYVDEIDVFCTA